MSENIAKVSYYLYSKSKYKFLINILALFTKQGQMFSGLI